jgi:3-hydroxyacyl-[acyl-carrier-protein] dehydratase
VKHPDSADGPPHRLIGEIVKCNAGMAAECRTVFPPNEPMFSGHFPSNPLVPGVVLIEALAQTARIAAAGGSSRDSRLGVSEIRQVKFFHAVQPNQSIALRAERMGEITGHWEFKVQALVKGQQVAAGEILLKCQPRLGP